MVEDGTGVALPVRKWNIYVTGRSRPETEGETSVDYMHVGHNVKGRVFVGREMSSFR